MAFDPLQSLRQANQMVQEGILSPLKARAIQQDIETAQLRNQLLPREMALKESALRDEQMQRQRLSDILGGMRGMSLDQQARAMIQSGNPDLISKGTSLLNAVKPSVPAAEVIIQKGEGKTEELLAEQAVQGVEKSSALRQDALNIQRQLELLKEGNAEFGQFANLKEFASKISDEIPALKPLSEQILNREGSIDIGEFKKLGRQRLANKILEGGRAISDSDSKVIASSMADATDQKEVAKRILEFEYNKNLASAMMNEFLLNKSVETGKGYKELQGEKNKILSQISAPGGFVRKTTNDKIVYFPEFYQKLQAAHLEAGKEAPSVEESLKAFKNNFKR